jgi:hypothetical protein
VSCPAATIKVSTAAELTSALSRARPGASISIADGIYPGHFVAGTSGTAANPIWLCGSSRAILDGGSVKSGYVLQLAPASFWRVVGLSVRGGQKGIVTDGTTGSFLQGLTVTDVGDEGIHLRAMSTKNVVRSNTVARTGRYNAKFGEGVYVGSAVKNWCAYSACRPDRSDDNQIIDNRISATTAENIDVKEGTTHGLISGNTFSGVGGLTAADSWVDVKGTGWVIESNVGQQSPGDGFQTHQILSGWGTRNVFAHNTARVNGPGYAIRLAPANANVVRCDNIAFGAARGLSNVSCTA